MSRLIEYKGFRFTLKPGGEIEVRSPKLSVTFFTDVVTESDLWIWAHGFMSSRQGWGQNL